MNHEWYHTLSSTCNLVQFFIFLGGLLIYSMHFVFNLNSSKILFLLSKNFIKPDYKHQGNQSRLTSELIFFGQLLVS